MNEVMPSAPNPTEQPIHARKGKLATLPLAVRREINERLDDGQQGPEILEWLNAQPAVRELLKKRWAGYPVTVENLSEWRRGGYQDWRRQREKIETHRALAETAMELSEAAAGAIAEGSAVLLAGKLSAALESATPAEAVKMVEAVHRLRAGDMARVRLDLRRRNVAQRDEAIALQQQRYRWQTTVLFLKWYENPKIREVADEKEFNYAEKIQLLGKMMFGEGWETEEEEMDRFNYDI